MLIVFFFQRKTFVICLKNGLTVSHGLILVQYSYLKFLFDAMDLSVVMCLHL